MRMSCWIAKASQNPGDSTGVQLYSWLCHGFIAHERGDRQALLPGLGTLFLLQMKATTAASILVTIVTMNHMAAV
jgi:hypothetical protein